MDKKKIVQGVQSKVSDMWEDTKSSLPSKATTVPAGATKGASVSINPTGKTYPKPKLEDVANEIETAILEKRKLNPSGMNQSGKYEGFKQSFPSKTPIPVEDTVAKKKLDKYKTMTK
jgi:hypothetical protein